MLRDIVLVGFAVIVIAVALPIVFASAKSLSKKFFGEDKS